MDATSQLPVCARYGTLIQLHRLIGIPYLGYPLTCTTTTSSSLRHLLTLITWLICFGMLFNGIYITIVDEVPSSIFYLDVGRSTALARNIAASQVVIFIVISFGEMAYFSVYFFGRQAAIIEREVIDTLEHLSCGLAARVVRTLNRSMATYYGVTLIHALLAGCGSILMGGSHLLEISPWLHVQNFQYFIIDTSLQGHTLYVATFYGTLLRGLAQEVIKLCTSGYGSGKESDNLVKLFVQIHDRIDRSRRLLGLLIALKVPILVLIAIQNTYLVMLHFVLGHTVMHETKFFLFMLTDFIFWIFTLCLISDYLADSKTAFYEGLQRAVHIPEVQRQAARYELLKQRAVSLCGCGYFTLGKSFIITILGSAITYSVILLQSDMGQSNNQ